MTFQAIVFLPLIGFLIAGLFGKAIGHRASRLITTVLVMIAALMSILEFPGIVDNGPRRILVAEWVNSGALQFNWAFLIDTLTAVMLVVVTSVSALVHLYSMGYMSHDPDQSRFFAYLSLFTFAMLMLVTADNFLQVFFGWEGVGLASYLLIGFWFKKPSANSAAIKAFVVNRVGDFGFSLGIFAIFVLFGAVDFDTVFGQAEEMRAKNFYFLGFHVHAITTICILLFVGAMGKSAQLLLHTWLPDAMEGPTPVSALIHAATMVTAGVFLVARCSPLFEWAPDARTLVTIIGATTAFFAATVGLVQNDIKRVIAYSTCSQLGYMFFAAGVGAYGAAIFHLFTHAFFKALLFLGAGSVIHAMQDEQDMRKMGGLIRMIPWTFCAMFVGTLALTGVGIPGFTGFAGYYSKDIIIEAAAASHDFAAPYAFYMGVIAAFMTSFYSWRLMFMTFYGQHRSPEEVLRKVHESPSVMLVPLLLLSLGAVFAGGLFHESFVGHDRLHFWNGALLTVEGDILDEAHHVSKLIKWSPTIAMLSGLLLAYLFYIRKPDLPGKVAQTFKPIYLFLLNKWYFDELYEAIFVKPCQALGRFFWKGGDVNVIDRLGPNGVAAMVSAGASRIRLLQSGYIYHYAFAMLIGVAAAITWFMTRGGV